MTDKYAHFVDLEQNEIINEDYAIFLRDRNSRIAVMAPHGGGIEPGTVDIADALAGCDYTFYAFKGIKQTGNRVLHISSVTFDEPRALKTARNADIVISIHGSDDKNPIVHVGGKHTDLKQAILAALQAGGFDAVISKVSKLMGIKPDNICNRCKTGKGVQLELSRGLRQTLFDNLEKRALRTRTIRFYRFVDILREAVGDIEKSLI